MESTQVIVSEQGATEIILAVPGVQGAVGNVSAHVAAADPHPQYLTPAEGNAAYATAAQGAKADTAVQGITGTAPIVSSGGATPAISISAATTSAAGSMSSADKTKLDGIAAGAEVNVNADWNASSGDAQILNKPSIPAPADAAPQPPGVAAIGSSTDYAREDHVHALPALVSTSSAGLVPETGTPSGKYLKDDATWAEIPSGGAEPAGAAGEIQINDGADPAGLGVVPGFGYDTDTLNVPGDVNLDDGIAGSVTTYQSVAPTANRTILFPDVTGIPGVFAGSSIEAVYHALWGGFTGAVPFVENGALTVSNGMGYDEVNGILSVRGGFTTAGALTVISTIIGNTTFTGRIINTVNAASNAPAGLFSGNWFTTGTSTTNKAAVLVEQTGATSTGWSPAGTGLGVNSASAFVGRLLDLQKNATSRFSVDHNGMVSYTQDVPVAANTTATLTAANIQNGIVTSDTTAAGVDLTLPTGTDMDTAFVGNYVNQAVYWSVINTGTNAATLLAGADHTIVGAAVVVTGTSGRFATRRTAANTWVSYRIS